MPPPSQPALLLLLLLLLPPGLVAVGLLAALSNLPDVISG